MGAREVTETFDCFGSSCAALVTGDTTRRSAREAAERGRRSLRAWHARFSRFTPHSELSSLNADPRREIPVSPLMARFANAVVRAGQLTGGLVDATLIDQIEAAGYAGDLGELLPLETALMLAPRRKAAAPGAARSWRAVEVSIGAGTVRRPPGVKLDSGGLAKGLFADVLAEQLAGHEAFAINCAGDLMVGGTGGVVRPIEVESPFDGSTLHTFRMRRTGVATSGIGRRAWLDESGRPAHHLLDPSTGTPAYTGVVQVTALAASAVTAEIRAKAAILSGPGAARDWLPDGGVIVLDDGSHEAIEPRRRRRGLSAPYSATDAGARPEGQPGRGSGGR
jgi:FAD:protein FMN transferase